MEAEKRVILLGQKVRAKGDQHTITPGIKAYLHNNRDGERERKRGDGQL